ncbi:MAG TPA: hypothetical protein VLZ81_05400, partial [Blastocatellia bacterium]|nr:hypothetical protein [Blastocatellia bacterium]
TFRRIRAATSLSIPAAATTSTTDYLGALRGQPDHAAKKRHPIHRPNRPKNFLDLIISLCYTL